MTSMSGLADTDGRAGLEQKVSLTYIFRVLMHFTYSVIFKSPSGSSPKSHFRQFKETGDHKSVYLERWEIYTEKKILPEIALKHTSVILFQ